MPVRALNLYYARDESARAQVLATRLRASDVREAIGIPRGRVFTRMNGAGDLPDVMWDCSFADSAAHDVDMQARAASADFEACRATMRTLTRRFERVIYAIHGGLDQPSAPLGRPLMQLWLVGLQTPDAEALKVAGTTAVLRRTDDNASLPDWIVEIPDPSNASETERAQQRGCEATRVRWQRVG